MEKEKQHPKFMEGYGERLKTLIQESEYKTGKVFSEKTGYSKVYISKLINEKSVPGGEFIAMLYVVFPDIDMRWFITGESRKSHLQFRVEQLERENEYYRERFQAVAKPFSNRINPQLPFPEYSRQKSAVFA